MVSDESPHWPHTCASVEAVGLLAGARAAGDSWESYP